MSEHAVDTLIAAPASTTYAGTTRVRRRERVWAMRVVWLLLLAFNLILFASGFAMHSTDSTRRLAGLYFNDGNGDDPVVLIGVSNRAAAAGVRAGDTLLAINGQPPRTASISPDDDSAVYTVQPPGGPPRDVVLTRDYNEPIIQAAELLGLGADAGRIYMLAMEALIVVAPVLVALLIFALRSDDWLALLLAYGLVIAGLAEAVSFFRAELPRIPPQNVVHLYGLIAFPTAMIGALLFPVGTMRPRWAWMPVIVYAAALVILPFLIPSNALNFGLPNLLIMLYVAYIAYRRYRDEFTPVQRQQTKWVVFGLMGFAGSLLIRFGVQVGLFALPYEAHALFAFFSRPVEIGLLLILPIGFAFSILRYRLWDVDVVINRSLVGGVVTAIVVLLYAGVFLAMRALADSLLGQDTALVPLVIAAAASGVAFGPIRRRVRTWIDRSLYGLRYDLNQIRSAQTPPIPPPAPDLRTQPNLPPGAFTGTALDGWTLHGMIGRGGMGEVYQGIDGDQRVAAIKILPAHPARRPESDARFAREARTLQALDHPNIVRYFGYGETDAAHYLAMEYIDGQELSARIRAGGPLDLTTAAAILRDVAAALDYAHARGLVHRDVKSSNIMLTRDGSRAVLMDFGIARITEDGTRYTGSGLIGTVDYMAPEQIMAAREVDRRADVYALGVVAYEMLTGARPFSGGIGQIVFAHLQKPVPDPVEVNPAIPRETAAAILRALAKNADARYPSAGAFARAMGAVERKGDGTSYTL